MQRNARVCQRQLSYLYLFNVCCFNNVVDCESRYCRLGLPRLRYLVCLFSMSPKNIQSPSLMSANFDKTSLKLSVPIRVDGKADKWILMLTLTALKATFNTKNSTSH